MNNWLFRKFLGNPVKYSEAQQFWESLWTRLTTNGIADASWKSPWMENSIADANPIFTAISKRCQRGVRIIQEEPGDPDDFDLDWWVDIVGEENSSDAIRELVIACCPSTDKISKVEKLLRDWIHSGVVLENCNGVPNNPADSAQPNPTTHRSAN